MKPGREWYVSYSIARQGVELFLRDGDNYVAHATCHVKKIEQGALVGPFMVIDRTEAQQLMQGLWNAGFRPNNGEGTSAQVTAMKEHLADLRRLVFKGEA